jgi:hypothetical protein
MQILYVSRAQWGATQSTENYISNRSSASPAQKTTIQVHHTASIDSRDQTPNRWAYENAVRYMRSLQTARPELGPLPYSMNLAVSEDAETVWLFEGRGILKIGAHTAGHNLDGVGYGIFGNFDLRDDVAALAAIGAIEADVALRRREGLVNLGQEKNPRGWNAWGHRDSSPKSCPGNHLYPLLANFRLDTQSGDDEMSLVARLMVVEAGSKSWLPTQADIDYWMFRADNLNNPAYAAEWRRDFEQMWARETQNEWKKLQDHPHGAPTSATVDQTARDQAAAAHAIASSARQDLDQIKSVIG